MENIDIFSNKFAYDTFKSKYSLDKQETWKDTAKRVTSAVCGQLLSKEDQDEICKLIEERKFIPGGRYLYSSGRPWHQVNNCFLFKVGDSREEWANLMYKATASLMSGGGIGVDYSKLRYKAAPIKRTGGVSTGPLALMEMINESGRHIMQGGSRRSAIWAGLQWDHEDCLEFIGMKNHSPELRELKKKDLTFPLSMELTNISVIYNTEFFIAMENEHHEKHKKAKIIWEENCKQAFSSAEPGFSFNFRKDNESTRNACVTGNTEILTDNGYRPIEELINKEINIWNGFEWSKVSPKITGENQEIVDVILSDGRTLSCTKYHTFHISTDYHGGKMEIKAKDLQSGMKLIKHDFPIVEHGDEIEDKFAYTQGFKSAEGMDGYKIIWIYEPKIMCISRLLGRTGKNYKNRTSFHLSHEQLEKNFVPFNWDLKGKLQWLSGLFDGDGTELKEGGLQLVSIDRTFLKNLQKLLSTIGIQCKILDAAKAGFRNMPDGKGGNKDYYCQDAFRICIGAIQMQSLKRLGLKCERMSFDKQPQRDASQFVTIVDIIDAGIVDKVYCFNEPKKHLGIFNGIITGQCTEVVSEDDSDKCNLGTVWINRFKDKKEFRKAIKYAVKFLMCGGIYSDVPTEKIREIGNKNNRIGLGLGGLHEWLMLRGEDYKVTPELHKWLSIYEQESDSEAFIMAKQLNVSVPKGVRAIAPNGTIGIISESSCGIEPLFCKAYKRRYFQDDKWLHQYVVDGSVKRLLAAGVKLEAIKDSFDLSFVQRVKFQADVQNYVDMAISSTCNLPEWGSETNNLQTLETYSDILLKYAKRLRGFTCYPNGCRDGQPLERCDINEAMASEGKVFEENETTCVGGVCGI